MAEQEKKQLSIEIDEITAQGLYSNLAMITHSEQEFILDFLFLSPQQPKAKVRARVITSPKHAKRLLAALIDNMKKYESRFGPIAKDQPAPPGAESPVFH